MLASSRRRMTCLVLVSSACVACDGSQAAVAERPIADASFDGATIRDAGVDGQIHDATADAADADVPDAPVPPVRLGIEPVPRAPSDAQGVALQVAQVESLSAGSRAISVDVRWDEVMDPQLMLRSDRLAQLRALSELVRRANARLSLCLALVDRAIDARPNNSLAWSSSQAHSAIERTIDALLPLFGEELRYVSFGLEVDRYYRAVPSILRGPFVATLKHALGYAREHSALGAQAQVSVVTTLSAWSAPTPTLRSLLEQSDVALLTYLPLDDQLLARPASVVAGDLDSAYAAIQDAVDPNDAGADATVTARVKPIVLHRVGYPSSAEAGSSEVQQQAFYAGLFQVLKSRRARFPFVSVLGLNDPEPQECEAFRLTLGVDALTYPQRAEAAYCSMGLHTSAGLSKAGWGEALGALATFALP